MAQYITKDGDTVDYVAWQYYGTQDGRVLEQVLEANKGLADLGPVLPPGVSIILPAIVLEIGNQAVRLWD